MMTNAPIRIAVTGITGQMGRAVIQCIIQQYMQQDNPKIILGAALGRSGTKLCGVDVGKLMNYDNIGVMITDNIKLVKKDFDILVDFSVPEATMEYLSFCKMYHKNMIIGTTGFSKVHRCLIEDSSNKIGIVCSSNFSIGIAVMLKLLKDITCIVGNLVDINIIETHHNKKSDIPSGTALMMKSVIERNMLKFQTLNKNILNIGLGIYDKLVSLKSLSGSEHNISIHSIRAGDIVGEHVALFSGIGECLEITHKAFNRSIFANGALHAAMWLGNSKIGLFNLNDVLQV